MGDFPTTYPTTGKVSRRRVAGDGGPGDGQHRSTGNIYRGFVTREFKRLAAGVWTS